MTKTEYRVQNALGLLPIAVYDCILMFDNTTVVGSLKVLAKTRKDAIKEAYRLLQLQQDAFTVWLSRGPGSYHWITKRISERG